MLQGPHLLVPVGAWKPSRPGEFPPIKTVRKALVWSLDIYAAWRAYIKTAPTGTVTVKAGARRTTVNDQLVLTGLGEQMDEETRSTAVSLIIFEFEGVRLRSRAIAFLRILLFTGLRQAVRQGHYWPLRDVQPPAARGGQQADNRVVMQ